MFYGWYIAAVAFLANFMSVGTSFYALNAFMEPVCRLHGWSRTDINLALVFGTFFAISGQLLFGTLVSRLGSRLLMSIGPLIGSFAFILLFRTEHLPMFYLFYILLFIGNGAYGGIVAGTTVNNWFDRNRGKAMGLAASGISLSGAVLPFVALLLIQATGIQTAALLIGLMILVVAPVCRLVVRDWPEENGYVPSGMAQPSMPPHECPESSTSRLRPSRQASLDWPIRRLVRYPAFWIIGLAFGLVMIGTVGVMSQLKPRFVDMGIGDTPAMALMSATALIGALGKYLWGALCDRLDPAKVVLLLVAGNAIGLGLSFLPISPVTLCLFILIFGFSMGGIISVFQILVADHFGREAFPAVYRYISLFMLFELAGFVIAGQSFDRTGSYDLAYWIFIGIDGVAVLLLLFLNRGLMKCASPTGSPR